MVISFYNLPQLCSGNCEGTCDRTCKGDCYNACTRTESSYIIANLRSTIDIGVIIKAGEIMNLTENLYT